MKRIQKTKARRLHTKHENPILIDGRRIYDPKQFNQKITYKAIGLGRKDL